MTVTGFSHVNINSVDFDRSLSFYAEVLGVNVTKKFPERSNTGALVGLAPPHTNLVATLSPGRGRSGIELIEWHLPDTPHCELADLSNGVAGIAALIFSNPSPSGVRDRASAVGLPWRETGTGMLEIEGPEGRVRVVEGPDAALVGAVVNVVNLDASIQCYQASLGLSAAAHTHFDDTLAGAEKSAEFSVSTKGFPFTIVLRQPAGGATLPAVQRRSDTPGFLRLAFMDDDVDGAYERAMLTGVRSVTPGDRFDFGSITAHAALWFDLDAVLVEVLHFEAPSS